MTSSTEFDVVILGSGFGGSLLAAILSKAGQTVCLVDRQAHPRFAIGESSTPAADMILHHLVEEYALDELLPLCRFGTWRETLLHLKCGCKRGFSYFWHGGEQGYQPSSLHENELLVAASSSRDMADTQWYRSDVDQFLCEYAQRCGVSVMEEWSVSAIKHEDENEWRLLLEQNEASHLLNCRFLVDATGPAGPLMKWLGIPETTADLHTKTSTIYSHFEQLPTVHGWLAAQDVDQRDFPYPVDDSAVHHLFSKGWLWQLRFEGGTTSVGFVAPESSAVIQKERSPDENWQALLDRDPVLKQWFGSARLAAIPGRIIQTDRLQRLFSQGAGSDWAALPFTIGFIDPLHSTGIAHTLLGVERLAKILSQSAVRNRQAELFVYSCRVIQELKHIDRLVAGCYGSLQNFEHFTAWTMLYFAAATTFENRFGSGNDNFLCAADERFSRTVEQLYDRHFASPVSSVDSSVSLVSQIREAIQAYNSVGLFSPKIRNMYHYTAAEKP